MTIRRWLTFIVPAIPMVLAAGCGDNTPPAENTVRAPVIVVGNDPPPATKTVPSEPVQPAIEAPASDKPASDKPASDKPASDKPASDKPASATHKREPNRLANETSPYLLLHAYNPVDWYAWGPEALERAKKEDKVIFLSVGYSACYWCHVMERESFMDEEIAKFLNEHFVCIKVDREERPDVDDVYMNALHAYNQAAGGGSAGWPLSMFLTPTGEPIAGGTYFPPRDQPNRPPGFLGVINIIHTLWTEDRKGAEQNAEILARHVQRMMRPGLVLEADTLDRELVIEATRSLVRSHDPEHGGIGFDSDTPGRPKFPTPAKLESLQYAIARDNSEPADRVLRHTLDHIADGGIHDHLGGGFHRYSTDRRWHVPHFEKMLYDNAQLANVYVEAFRQTGEVRYREVAEDVFTYVLRDMTDPEGPFYSAQDAETDTVEGKYYAWSAEEIDEVLGGDDSKLFRRRFGVVAEPEFEEGNVLNHAVSLEDLAKDAGGDPAAVAKRLAAMRARLLAVRGKRPAPLKDDKVLTSWNGLMIRAFANGGRVLKRPEYVQAAERAATFLLKKLRHPDDQRLLRTFRKDKAHLNAYLDDYAFLVEGLLALHQATGKANWLAAARELTDRQIEMFWDKDNKGFYFTSHDHETLLARTRNAFDSVLPSGNGVSIRNLVRLAKLTGEAKYRDHARETLRAFMPRLRQHQKYEGLGMSHLAMALGEYLDEFKEPDKPKPPPKSDKPKPSPKSDKPKPSPKSDKPKPSPKSDKPKPSPKSDKPKPSPKSDKPKPSPKSDKPKPSPKSDKPKPSPKSDKPKPSPKSDKPKPSPKSDKPKPSPKSDKPARSRA